MDLAKLGLKPFKKVESNEPVLPVVDASADAGAGDSGVAVHNAAPEPEAKDDRHDSSSVVAVASGTSALKALLAKQPKPEPKPESPGSSLPAVLDLPIQETIPPGPEGFQFHLDRLDALIQRDGGITALTQDSIKGKIKDIFTELNQFPEYDGLIIDRDVHNIMRFMQHSLSAVQVATEKKVATRTKKAEEKAKPKFNFDLSGMDGMLIGATAAPKTIESLGTLDVDAIETKFRRGGK